MTENELKELFGEKFGACGETRLYFAPGRVNLIGEHTDYNGGYVFPCALTIGTYVAARKREDKKIRLYSINFDECGVIEGSLDSLVYDTAADWANYPFGMVWSFIEKGYAVDTGFEMAVYGNIPNASGLSSSSSVEVAVGAAIADLYGHAEVSMQDIALLGQYTENNFIGVNCGIMDQFAIAMGKKDHAIFLNCGDLSHTYVPVRLEDSKLVIACSNKKRGLGDSRYNERRAECEEALREIQTKLNIQSLCEMTGEEFELNKYLIKSHTLRRRAMHVVYENQRVIQAVQVLNHGDIEAFGVLMNESHVSLRDYYEVTGKELDTLVEAAWDQEGVIGSRMTGAGFGGCTVSIVKNDCVDAFIRNVGKIYERKIGYKADFYIVEIGDGGKRLS